MRHSGDKLAAKLDSLVLALQEVADSLRSNGVKLSESQLARIEDYRKKALCLFCGLPLEGETRRGLHQGCYNNLRQRISRGEITETIAIENGWYDPRTRKPGRKSQRPDPMRVEGVHGSQPSATALAAANKVAPRRERHRDKRKSNSP